MKKNTIILYKSSKDKIKGTLNFILLKNYKNIYKLIF